MIKEQQNSIKSTAHGAEKNAQIVLESIKSYQAQGGTAYTYIDEKNALKTAKAMDLLFEVGTTLSPLAGLPVSIKDLFDIEGQKTLAGSKVLCDLSVATADAISVNLLKKAGAVIVGRTNMSEFAFSGIGYNPHYGTPVFADNFTRIAGGSTSGGAVSVALGHTVASLGTDTGGSLRIPAAFCNLVGFKPSANRVDKTGAFPLSFSLDSVGAITTCVEDSIILDEILTQQPFHHKSLSPKQLNLAITEDYFLDDADEQVAKTFHLTLQRLQATGVNIEIIALPELYDIPKINATGGLTAAEAWSIHQKKLIDDKQNKLFDSRVSQRVLRGKDISSADYLNIQQQRRVFIARVADKLSNFDALLHPTVAIVPPLAQPLIEDETLFFKTNALVLRNTTVTNMLDGCAISIPCKEDNVLPIGLSIVGLHGQDSHILTVAKTIAQIINSNQGA